MKKFFKTGNNLGDAAMLMQDFAAGLTYRALPESVLWVLRRSLLDTLGVAAIGSQSDMAKIGTKTAQSLFGATANWAEGIASPARTSSEFYLFPFDVCGFGLFVSFCDLLCCANHPGPRLFSSCRSPRHLG